MPPDPIRLADTAAWLSKARLDLRSAAVEIDPSLEALLREAAPLTEFAWKYRYPGEFVEPPPEQVTPILALAKEVVEAIATRISGT